jgi:peptidoglycan-associated lipoprotein
MQKKVLKGVSLLLMLSGLLLFISCAQTDVQSTPDAPKAQLATDTTASDAADQDAAKRALEEEAIRKEQEAAKNAFISEDVYFDYDDSSLTSAAQAVLQTKAGWLRNNPDAAIVIEGHCDERGTTEYNLALGDRRANSAKTFLVDMGIPASRFRTVSYGEEMPVDPGKTEEAWAKNRRAHFTIE